MCVCKTNIGGAVMTPEQFYNLYVDFVNSSSEFVPRISILTPSKNEHKYITPADVFIDKIFVRDFEDLETYAHLFKKHQTIIDNWPRGVIDETAFIIAGIKPGNLPMAYYSEKYGEPAMFNVGNIRSTTIFIFVMLYNLNLWPFYCTNIYKTKTSNYKHFEKDYYKIFYKELLKNRNVILTLGKQTYEITKEIAKYKNIDKKTDIIYVKHPGYYLRRYANLDDAVYAFIEEVFKKLKTVRCF